MKRVLFIIMTSNDCALLSQWLHIEYDNKGFKMILFWACQIISLPMYEDRLGPSVDWLSKSVKSWDDIIDSAIRPGGKDLGF